MTHRHLTRRLNYQKVLVAVYWTADADGLLNEATDAAIGRACGLSGATVSSYLRWLERAGAIDVYLSPFGGRYLILRDHPDAEAVGRRLRRSGEWVGGRNGRYARA